MRLVPRPIVRLTFLLVALSAAPSSAQTTADLRARVQATLDSLAAAPGIPGMTLGVALPDGTTFSLAAGVADTSVGAPMPADGKMLQGSVGKTYFGAVALQLVAEGLLELDAPVSHPS